MLGGLVLVGTYHRAGFLVPSIGFWEAGLVAKKG